MTGLILGLFAGFLAARILSVKRDPRKDHEPRLLSAPHKPPIVPDGYVLDEDWNLVRKQEPPWARPVPPPGEYIEILPDNVIRLTVTRRE